MKKNNVKNFLKIFNSKKICLSYPNSLAFTFLDFTLERDVNEKINSLNIVIHNMSSRHTRKYKEHSYISKLWKNKPITTYFFGLEDKL